MPRLRTRPHLRALTEGASGRALDGGVSASSRWPRWPLGTSRAGRTGRSRRARRPLRARGAIGARGTIDARAGGGAASAEQENGEDDKARCHTNSGARGLLVGSVARPAAPGANVLAAQALAWEPRQSVRASRGRRTRSGNCARGSTAVSKDSFPHPVSYESFDTLPRPEAAAGQLQVLGKTWEPVGSPVHAESRSGLSPVIRIL